MTENARENPAARRDLWEVLQQQKQNMGNLQKYGFSASGLEIFC